jgi:hypothetical protein
MAWVEAVYADHFVYQDSNNKLFDRGYSIEDGKVVLADGPKEVTRKVVYEVASRSQVVHYEVVSTATCGCGGRGIHHASAEEDGMKPKKERVAAIISSGKTCFVAADAAVLEQLPDERIKALEDHVAAAVTAAAAPPFVKEETEEEKKKRMEEEEKAKKEAAAAEMTPEQKQASFYKDNPDVAEIVKQHKATAATKRAELVGQLKAAQKAYSETELQALPLEMLEKLALIAVKEKPSYVGAGAPRAAADGSADEVPPAPSMKDLVLASRGIKTAA